MVKAFTGGSGMPVSPQASPAGAAGEQIGPSRRRLPSRGIPGGILLLLTIFLLSPVGGLTGQVRFGGEIKPELHAS